MDRDLLTAEQKLLVAQLSEHENEDALYADGFEEAFCGITYRHALPPVASYDVNRCIEVLMRRDGMTYEEAWEYFSFNVLGAYVGDHTPCFVRFSDGFKPYEPTDEELERAEGSSPLVPDHQVPDTD